jgi:hypothetical protein
MLLAVCEGSRTINKSYEAVETRGSPNQILNSLCENSPNVAQDPITLDARRKITRLEADTESNLSSPSRLFLTEIFFRPRANSNGII